MVPCVAKQASKYRRTAEFGVSLPIVIQSSKSSLEVKQFMHDEFGWRLLQSHDAQYADK